MTYKEKITELFTEYSKDPQVVHVGYNVLYGKAGGTLIGVDEKQLIETPVCENLMVGMAIGMSLNGYKPIVYFERMDFIMNAMDAIINHAVKLKDLSGGLFCPNVWLRCVVGNSKKPLYTGSTHTQDFSWFFGGYMRVFDLDTYSDYSIRNKLFSAKDSNAVRMTIEYKDLYDEQV